MGTEGRAIVTPSGFLLSRPLYFPYSFLSYLLVLYPCLIFILTVPMHKYLGKHTCVSSTFPIAYFRYLCFSRGEINLALAKDSTITNE